MWKSRITNYYKVYKFTDKFTNDVLMWACENPGINSVEEIEKTNMSDELAVFAKNKTYTRFRKEMVNLTKCKEIIKVQYLFNLYKNKYINIIQGSTKIRCTLDKETLEILKNTFEYYYKELLDNPLFWKVYNPYEEYKTKKEVREQLSKNRVCPYCDQTYITSIKKTNMDHYLPISQFPFMGIHWRNLIVSCSMCNGILLKNSRWFLPILNPNFDDIERVIFFTFDKEKREIGIINKNKANKITRCKQRGKNFLKLFDFNEMYSGSWCEVDNEHNLIDIKLENAYHRYKGKLNKDNIYNLVEESIEVRRNELKEKAGKMSFAKLKYDYSNDYKQNLDREILNWFLMEQKGR